MFTRSLGKLFRGKATPFQIFSACILGSIVSFLPAIFICPELYIIMFMFILILNTNLLIAALTALPCKLISMLIAPVSIQVGHLILDGPLGNLLKPLINSPLFSWMGLEHYLVIGSMFFGLMIGIAIGIASVSLIKSFRTQMAALDNDEEKFKKLRENKLFKIVIWIFLGSDKAKGEYQELLDKKVGNPIRILGVIIFILGLSTFLTIAYMYQDSLLKNYITESLEITNGASVDIDGVSSDIFSGKISITHIAMADSKNLMKNKMELNEVTMDIDVSSLLTKKFHIELISVGQVKLDTDRKVKASIIEPPKTTEKKTAIPPTKTEATTQTNSNQDKLLESLNLEEYFEEYKQYYDDAQSLRKKANDYLNNKFVQKLINNAKKTKKEKEAKGASFSDAIRDQFKNFTGKYAYATHLVDKAPFIHIKKFKADKVIFGNPKLKGTTIEINHISSAPSLLNKPIQLVMENKTLEYNVEITLDKLMSYEQLNKFSIIMKNIDGEKLGKKIKISNEYPLKKGSIDIKAKGEFAFNVNLGLKGNILINDGLIDIKQLTNKAMSNFEMPSFYGKKINAKALNQITLNEFNLEFTLNPFSNPPEYKMNLSKLGKDLTDKIKNDIKNRLKNMAQDLRDQLLDQLGINKELFNKENLKKEFTKQKEAITKEVKETADAAKKEVKKEVKKNTDLAKKEGQKEIKKILDGKKPEDAGKDILNTLNNNNGKDKPKKFLKGFSKKEEKKEKKKNLFNNIIKKDKKKEDKDANKKEDKKKKKDRFKIKNPFN